MQPYLLSLFGGALIGTAISLMLLFNGRVAGVNESLKSISSENFWRWSFIAGLLTGGFFWRLFFPEALRGTIDRPLIVGSVLFGFGWGLAGCCPAPAITALISFYYQFFLSVFLYLHLFLSPPWAPG